MPKPHAETEVIFALLAEGNARNDRLEPGDSARSTRGGRSEIPQQRASDAFSVRLRNGKPMMKAQN
jgi:hypothetical protein